MLAKKLKTLDGLDESFKAHYKKVGEEYVLDIEGDTSVADRAKVDEFRTNNRTLHSQLEAAQTAAKVFEGVDPEAVKKAQKMIADIESEEERKLIAAGDIETVFARRTTAMKTEHGNALAAQKVTLDSKDSTISKLRKSLGVHTIEAGVQKAMSEMKVKPRVGALEDILGRAHKTFRVDDAGLPTAYQGVFSDEKRFGSDGNPLSTEEFVRTDLLKGASHLFEPAKGGGGGGGDGDPPRPAVSGQVDRHDHKGFLANLDDIASGKVKVINEE